MIHIGLFLLLHHNPGNVLFLYRSICIWTYTSICIWTDQYVYEHIHQNMYTSWLDNSFLVVAVVAARSRARAYIVLLFSTVGPSFPTIRLISSIRNGTWPKSWLTSVLHVSFIYVLAHFYVLCVVDSWNNSLVCDWCVTIIEATVAAICLLFLFWVQNDGIRHTSKTTVCHIHHDSSICDMSHPYVSRLIHTCHSYV